MWNFVIFCHGLCKWRHLTHATFDAIVLFISGQWVTPTEEQPYRTRGHVEKGAPLYAPRSCRCSRRARHPIFWKELPQQWSFLLLVVIRDTHISGCYIVICMRVILPPFQEWPADGQMLSWCDPSIFAIFRRLFCSFVSHKREAGIVTISSRQGSALVGGGSRKFGSSHQKEKGF